MAIETATYIGDLVATNPDGATSNVDELDNHIRLVKAVLQAQFPNLGAGAVTKTAAELNAAAQTGAANTFTELQSFDGGADVVNDHVDHFEGVASGGGNPTIMLFQQTTAPVGWTKLTTHNNKALRIVTGAVGSGGATAFTSVFGGSKFTGLEGNHDHTYSGTTSGPSGTKNTLSSTVNPLPTATHTHTYSGSTSISPAHAHSLSLDLQYVDLILAQKD